MADEKDFKIKADLSQLMSEIDKAEAKLAKLSQSFEKVSEKFGKDSPQLKMVENHLKMAAANYDKTIADFGKYTNKNFGFTVGNSGGGSGGGSIPNTAADRDLDRNYKREFIKNAREYRRNQNSATNNQGKHLQGIVSGLAGRGGVFNPSVIAGIMGLMRGVGGGFGGGALGIGAGALGARIFGGALGGVGAGAAGGAIAGGANAGAAGAAAMAGSTQGMIIGNVSSILKNGMVIKAVATAAIAADFLVASRGSARGKYATGLGSTVGDVSASQVGFERYGNANDVMDAMFQAKSSIQSPQYLAMHLLHQSTDANKDPALMMQDATAAMSKQLQAWYKQNPQTWLDMARNSKMTSLGYTDQELNIIRQDPKGIDKARAQARKDAPSYNLDKEQIKLLQDNVLWMKGMATAGETDAEYLVAMGTKVTELTNDILPKVIDKLNNLIDPTNLLSLGFNYANTQAQNFGKTLHDIIVDWASKNILPNIPSLDAQPNSAMTLGNGGFVIPGGSNNTGGPANRSLRNRGSGSSWGGGRSSPGGKRPPLGTANGPGNQVNILGAGTGIYGSEINSTFLGMDAANPEDRKKINDYIHNGGINLNAEEQAWCAAFVNAQLAHEGIVGSQGGKGVGVSSFYNWGTKTTADAAVRGDVIIDNRGGHVGRFTGERNAAGDLGFYSGNASDPPGTPPNPNQRMMVRSQWGSAGVRWVHRGEIVDIRHAPPQPKANTPVSMNNMDHFQGNNKSYAIRIDNQAGANYAVSSGMLGSGSGNYG